MNPLRSHQPPADESFPSAPQHGDASSLAEVSLSPVGRRDVLQRLAALGIGAPAILSGFGDDDATSQTTAADGSVVPSDGVIRRIVTGHDESGAAVFVSDEPVAPTIVEAIPEAEFFELWGADTLPEFPDDGAPPPIHTFFPPLGGFRFAQ